MMSLRGLLELWRIKAEILGDSHTCLLHMHAPNAAVVMPNPKLAITLETERRPPN